MGVVTRLCPFIHPLTNHKAALSLPSLAVGNAAAVDTHAEVAREYLAHLSRGCMGIALQVLWITTWGVFVGCLGRLLRFQEPAQLSFMAAVPFCLLA